MTLHPVFRSLWSTALPGVAVIAVAACTPSGAQDTASVSAPSGAIEIPAKAVTSAPSAVVADKPEPSPAIEERPSTVVAEPTTAAAPVKLGLEHQDPDVDHLDRAQRKLDDDDLVGAFVSLRKHLYDQPETAEVLLELASIGRRLGEVAVAKTALLRAEAIAPSSAAATELARLYLEDGNREAAREAAQRAVRRDRTDPAAFNQLGRIEMAESQWQRAEMAFRHALELDPIDAMVHNNIGLLYVRMGRGELAVDALQTAVELFGEAAPHFVFNNLGLAHELTADLTSAREAFEEALLVQPFYTRAKVNLDRVERALARQEAERWAPPGKVSSEAGAKSETPRPEPRLDGLEMNRIDAWTADEMDVDSHGSALDGC